MSDKHNKNLWLEASGWKYYNYDLEGEISLVVELKPMLNLWRSKYSGGKLPAWRDFEISEFDLWQNNFNLTKVHHNPFDLVYLRCGASVAKVYKHDFTGKTIRSADPTVEEDCDIEHFLRLYGNKKIGLSEGLNHWSGKSDLFLQFLDLPLSDNGSEITHFLTFMVVKKVF